MIHIASESKQFKEVNNIWKS